MRRVTMVLCAAAVLVLAAGTANAWVAYMGLNNYSNAADSMDVEPYTTANPAAASGGVLWINAGTGPVPTRDDVNMEFLGSTTQNGTYRDLAVPFNSDPNYGKPALFLLSIAQGDIQSAIGWNVIPMYPVGPGNPNGSNPYQGCFYDPTGPGWGLPDGSGGYIADGGYYYVKMRAWTGNYSTYAGAYAAAQAHTPGVYVGETAAFSTHFAAGLDPNVGDCGPMPALILSQPVPEPSTTLLTLSGLVGLLAYAWRKRK